MVPVLSDATTLADLLNESLERRPMTLNEIAERCGVSYQTVKNAFDGKSINVRFFMSLLDIFDVRKDPKLLRRFLLAFLMVQFMEKDGDYTTGEQLLRQAKLL